MLALFAAVLVWQAVAFAGLGKPFGMLVFGAILAVATAICGYIIASTKLWNTAAKAVFVLAVLVLAVSRYGFYPVSVI